MGRALDLRSLTAIAVVVGAGCSLAHDFEGLAETGEGGAGGAVPTGTSALTASASQGATDAASTSADASSGVGSSSSGCTPKTCAEISPIYALPDNGCGAPLVCGCDQGSTPNPATGQCECSTALVASPVAYPSLASQITGHQPWSEKDNITVGMSGSAVSLLDDGQVTNYLQARGYDLKLPAGARVKRIHAKICERQTGGGVRDDHVRLLFNVQATGEDAKRDQTWPGGTSCTPRNYDWPVPPNTTLLDYDASVFQGTGFGIQIMARNNGPNASNAHVGYMTVSVDYVPACTAHAF